MKRSIAFLMCLSFITCAYSIDLSDKQSIDNGKLVLNSAFLIDGLKTSTSIAEGNYGLCFESQTAFSRIISGKAIEELLFSANGFLSTICIGPQINLQNNALEGLLIGTYPGFILRFNENIGIWRPRWICDASYNTIIYRNIMIGVSIRKDILLNKEVEIGLKIGIAMENSNYKVQ